MPIQPVYAHPLMSQFKPANHATNLTFTSGHPATDAYDNNNSTYAEFNYETQATGSYLELNTFGSGGGTVSQVDFVMRYAAEVETKNGMYRILYYVDPSGTATVLQDWTGLAYTLNTRVWASQAEPNNGTWEWADVQNIRFRVETQLFTQKKTPTAKFSEYEGWVNVHFSPPATPTVYIDPENYTDTSLTPENLTIRPNSNGAFKDWTGAYTAWDETTQNGDTDYVNAPVPPSTIILRPNGDGTFTGWNPAFIIRPDGDGTYTAWSGTYTDWDDVAPDGDATYISANAGDLNESSTLANPLPPATGSITKVRVTIIARNTLATSNESVRLMLVIGGNGYNGSIYTPTTSYGSYTSEWSTNPATASSWTWAEINASEAGIRSEQVGAEWTGAIRVTQLYVEILASTASEDYTFWNETVHNGDTDYVKATADQIFESSTLTDLGWTSTDAWSIHSVEVTIVARTNITTDERITAMLAIGGASYPGATYSPTTTYKPYTSRWSTNPATGTYWTHSDVNALQAGVTSVLVGSWTGKLMVTQLFVSVVPAPPATVILRPDGDGIHTAWTGTYLDWDDATPDGDSTYVYATATALRESSTLADISADWKNPDAELWSIEKVRLTIVARVTMPDEKFKPTLVIGGTAYDGSAIAPTTSYNPYIQEWSTNPATGTYWTHSDVNALEAGVLSQLYGASWTGELRVTQLYLTVFAGLYESSTLEDSTGESWGIARVKVHAFARTQATASEDSPDEKLILGLVIGGDRHTALRGGRVLHTANETYKEFTSEWGINPATSTYWTWSDIDALEACVARYEWANQTGPLWTGEMRVTQLYVEVSGKRLEVDVCVDYVVDLWSFQFDLTFNPDVIQGTFHEDDVFVMGPFLGSAGAPAVQVPGAGWNNKLGRLSITSAILVLGAFPPPQWPDKCPDGGGVLATITFDVVGKGESKIRLGANTMLKDYNGDIIVSGRDYVQDGYFRNVLTTLMPTATFTATPVNTPPVDGPLEGYYTEFDGTPSTATSGKTIETYKWYLWETIHKTLYEFPTSVFSPDGDGTYTDWMNNTAAPANYTLWDDPPESAYGDYDATYVKATAGDMYESSTLEDHTTETGPIEKVRVTFFARTTETSEITDELVYPILVIGGKTYNGSRHSLDIVYTECTQEWSTNPHTGTAWDWSAIDSLEVGVASEQVGTMWTGEMRVTQIYIEVFTAAIVSSTDSVSWDTVICNYTLRGNWNVTLTVIDSDDVVSSNASYVEIKAHDVYIIDINTDTLRVEFPRGTNVTDIDSVLEIEVTAENQGDFPETFDVTCFWGYYYLAVDYYGFIPNGTGQFYVEIKDLAAGASTTIFFYWNTTGFNLTHPILYYLRANASRVQYEYDIEMREGKIAPNQREASEPFRVRFHDIAVTDIDLFNHLVIKPNGDGTYTDWNGTYTDWDDYPTHDGDTTTVNATDKNWYESSTLEDHTTETWSISNVRVTIVARTNITASSDRVKLMLVIGGTFTSTSTTAYSLTTSYAEYTIDWAINPATASAWTWSDIDGLEAGVASYRTFGTWACKLMVTQLYVEVFASTLTSPVDQGEMIRIEVTVDNEGDFTETNFDITSYYDSTAIGTQMVYSMCNYTYAEQELPGNDTITLSFIWDTTSVSSGTYAISASNSTTIPDDYEPHDNTFIGDTVTVGAAVPEFPLGVALEIALIAIIIYIWQKKRHGPKLNKLSTIPNH